MKSSFFVFIVVLFLACCKQLQPVIETNNYKNDYLKALIELDQCNRAYRACDTNFSKCKLKQNKDSFTINNFWRDVYFTPTDSTVEGSKSAKKRLEKELNRVDTIYRYKGVILPSKPQIVTVEKTPWWAYLTLYLSIGLVISNIILFFLLMRKIK